VTRSQHLEYVTLAVVAGFATALQSRVNGALSLEVGSGAQAALVSFSVGWLVLIVFSLFKAKLRAEIRNVVSALRTGELKWWQVVGGTMGAMFVLVQSFTVPLLGVAIFTIATIAAQTGSALLVDRSKIGINRFQITRGRVFAAIVAILGVLIAIANRINDSNFALWAVAAALFVGGLVAVQHALNGRVTQVSGSAIAAAWLNFAFGVTVLAIFNLTLVTSGVLEFSALPIEHPYLFLGGVLGVTFIVIAAYVIRQLGSLQFTLAATAGQLFGAVMLDLLVPLPTTVLSINLFIGLFVTASAVALASRSRR
jgi:bacterial/archaeal transporter family-2 protein